MRESAEMRSNASRSEMSRTWSETRRSRGGFHVGSAARSALDVEQDCARALGAADTPATARMAIASCFRDRRLITGRPNLGASSRCRCPMKNRDVSLPLDASTERESDDIENSVNRLTRKRCRQVQIRQGRIRNS
jgi:hypothetical protein